MTIPPPLVVVVMPRDTGVLEAELGGIPAGRHLIDAVRHCDLPYRVVAPEGAEVAGWATDGAPVPDESRAGGVVALIDGRAWLPREALAALLRLDAFKPTRLRASGAGAGHPALALLLPSGTFDARRPAPGAAAAAGAWLSSGSADETIVDPVTLPGGSTARMLLSFADLASAEQALMRGRATEVMVRGVRVRDPETLRIRGELRCGAGVEIEVDVVIEGTVILGDGVRIGAHSILIDAEVGARTSIKPFSLVERATIGANGFVGPYARIRPGTAIGDEVQIGNYVEIKASRIGAGSRINHHAFIGDADLANRVTIGAGTITCNHDGVGSTRTIIEEGAYVGSGCELVAPITIGAGATVGAGSTLTENVPPSTLAIARCRQVSVLGWQGPQRDPA